MLGQFSASYFTRDVVFHFSTISICSVHFLTVLFTFYGFFTSFTALVLPLKQEVRLDCFFSFIRGSSSKVITTSSSFPEDIFNECEISSVQSRFVFLFLKMTGNN